MFLSSGLRVDDGMGGLSDLGESLFSPLTGLAVVRARGTSRRVMAVRGGSFFASTSMMSALSMEGAPAAGAAWSHAR